MKTILLKGELRSEVGTRTAKELRHKGMVPCVMYSDGKEAKHFAIYQADFKNLVYTPNAYKVKLFRWNGISCYFTRYPIPSGI